MEDETKRTMIPINKPVIDSMLRIRLKIKAKKMSYRWAAPTSISAEDNGPLEFFDAQKRYHRDDGPAVIFPDGDTYWFINGTMHREDGPARIWKDRGIETWIKDAMFYEPSAHELMLWKMKKKES